MSRSQVPFLARSSRIGWILLATLGVGMALACGADPSDPESQEQILLDRAVRAVWGERDPGAIRSMRQRLRYEPAGTAEGLAFELEILTAGPERYREERRSPFGIDEVFVMNGETEWALVDGTVVPLSEAEVERRRLQPWLVEISKLTPLRDTEAFDLDHRGERTLEDGTELTELRVIPREEAGLTLTFGFDRKTHLPLRVTLESKVRRESNTLELSDYREVDGVQVAHRIRALRGEELLATQTLASIEFNPEVAESTFSPPLDLNRDVIHRKARGFAGDVAFAPLDGELEDTDDVLDAAEKLKEWIAEEELTIIGPLALFPTGLPSGAAKPVIAIAISPPTGPARKGADGGMGTAKLSAHEALCLTHVGDEAGAQLTGRLREEASKRELKTLDHPVEIWFSADGATRQFQLPLR